MVRGPTRAAHASPSPCRCDPAHPQVPDWKEGAAENRLEHCFNQPLSHHCTVTGTEEIAGTWRFLKEAKGKA